METAIIIIIFIIIITLLYIKRNHLHIDFKSFMKPRFYKIG